MVVVIVRGLAETVESTFCERDLVLDEAYLAFEVFDFLPPFVPSALACAGHHAFVTVILRAARFGVGELLDHGLEITTRTGNLAFKG